MSLLVALLGGAAAQTLTDGGAIASAEAFGAGRIQAVLLGGGSVPSGEAFGSGRIQEALPSGGAIPTAEAFGTGRLAEGLPGGGGVGSAEALGTGLVSERLLDGGAIPSAEAFGVGSIPTNATLTDGGGIASQEEFGEPAIVVPIAQARGYAGWEAYRKALEKAKIRPIPKPTIRLRVGGDIPSSEALGIGRVIVQPRPTRAAIRALALVEEEIYA